MRFKGMMTTIGAATLLLALAAPEVDAQRGRLGVLRPAPRPSFGGARPRAGVLAPHFFNSCILAPSFFPFWGGFPFVNIQVLATTQPAPDPTSHILPDPSGQPVPLPGSHPLPNVQPPPGMSPIPGATTVSAHGVPVYGAPVYNAPVYAAATPVATPRVTNGMVVGDIIDDPTFGLWGGLFFGGGGIVCGPTRLIRGF
jgi:hypothetical protein